jgi:cytochrome P450
MSADVTRPGFPTTGAAQPKVEAGIFLRVDGPEHDRIRRMLTREFRVKNARELRPQMEQLVDTLLGRILEHGPPAELVAEYAHPFPAIVTADLLGVPADQRERFGEIAIALGGLTTTPEQKEQIYHELGGLFRELIAERTARPTGDLISRVVADHVRAGELSEEELERILVILFSAGQDTTANMISLSIMALLRHPDQLRLLRSRPEIVPSAVEELLRFFSIVHGDPRRVATEAGEYCGCPLNTGDGVVVSLMTANHDSAVFGREDGPGPETLDLTRNPRRHLAFGFGEHQCLGQNIARVELEVALPRLFERIPDLRLAVPFEELQYDHESLVFGLESLPVTW